MCCILKREQQRERLRRGDHRRWRTRPQGPPHGGRSVTSSHRNRPIGSELRERLRQGRGGVGRQGPQRSQPEHAEWLGTPARRDCPQPDRQCLPGAGGCVHHATLPVTHRSPDFLLKWKWLPAAITAPPSSRLAPLVQRLRRQRLRRLRAGERLRSHDAPACLTSGSKRRRSSSRPASSGCLSFRQRAMRGNRRATPDLCLLETAMPSKAS